VFRVLGFGDHVTDGPMQRATFDVSPRLLINDESIDVPPEVCLVRRAIANLLFAAFSIERHCPHRSLSFMMVAVATPRVGSILC
jgi:hypothetical protein